MSKAGVAESATPVAVTATTPAEARMQMVQAFIAKGVSVEQMTQLLDLQDRWEKTEARKAFNAALVAFKANPPEIFKRIQVSFGNTKYNHAALEDVSEQIGKGLAQFNLMHTWRHEQAEGKIKVFCALRHTQGHSEEVSLEGPYDTSGSKNPVQAIVSTKSYLERHTLLSAVGIAPKAVDDDGRGGVEVHQMDPRVKADYAAAIDTLADRKAAEVLWQQIATESTRCGDVAAYAELKAAVSAKVKKLAKKEEL